MRPDLSPAAGAAAGPPPAPSLPRYDHYRQVSRCMVDTSMLILSGCIICVSMGAVMILALLLRNDHLYAHRAVVSARLVTVVWP